MIEFSAHPDCTKFILGFPDYTITKDGQVWSTPRRDFLGHNRRGRWLNPRNRNKYLSVDLSINSQAYTHSIHRLVLETYIGPCPPGMIGRHLNGNNQDNRLENLCWGTPKENQQDRIRHGTSNRGERCGTSKLTEQKVRTIVSIHKTGLFTYKGIAFQFDVGTTSIWRIIKRKTWKHLQIA